MKAVRLNAFGSPEMLKVEEVPVPEPAEGEILVRIHGASINPVDHKIRSGNYPRVQPDKLPLTSGRDVSGTVERCGPGVTIWEPGAAVYAMLPEDRGGYAEFVAVPARDCAAKPEATDHVRAAAVPLAGLTAWQGLFDHGGLQEGQHVLIHGAAGGVGHFAVQFARARGATVSATCSPCDLEFVRGLGARQVVDYKNQRFEDLVHDVDLVFDLVGGETQDRSWSVLKQGGMIVSTLMPPSKEKAKGRGRGANYLAQPSGPQLTEITRLVDAAKVTPTIERTFTLAEAADAQLRLENGSLRGKLVLQVR
jgi:NADPH:quinone reductase-like Zn-dependent oxidoreductase